VLPKTNWVKKNQNMPVWVSKQDGCGLAFLHGLLAESQQSKAPAREKSVI
jgi:hypothetical protein